MMTPRLVWLSITGSIAVSMWAAPSNAAIGRTEASFAVSSTGTASYTIPITIPSGVRGLKPDLAINYSSGSGNGLLGVGWNLAGFSTISRCDKTWAQDGVGASPQLDANDRFCLDGARLRVTSGTYGANGSTYQTELANFSLIIANGTAGNGPAWFEVKGKDGLIYEYGNTVDSAILASGNASVRVWALKKVRDRTGNSMKFNYTNDTANGSYRPSSIEYTFTSLNPSSSNYRVLFNYQSRATADGLWSYTIGGKNNEFNLLNAVQAESWNGSAWIMTRKYTMTYATAPATSRSRISSIQECAASTSDCFPATTITYQDGGTGWGSEVASSGTLTNMAYSLPLDINGDGLEDLVYPDNATSRWWYALGTTTGGYTAPTDSGLTSANYTAAVPIDFNSDGKHDILVKNASGNWRAMMFTTAGSGFTYTDTATVATGAAEGFATAGDVDGDGRDDIIYLVSGGAGYGQSDYIYYRLNTGSAFSSSQLTLASFINGATSGFNRKFGSTRPLGTGFYRFQTRTRLADFNDDGRMDLMVYIGTCYADQASKCGNASNPIGYAWILFASQPSGAYGQFNAVNYSQGNQVPFAPPLRGDYNGDGCTDIAYTVSDAWRLRAGTCGRAGTASILDAEVATGVPYYGYTALAVDWDGDGRTDIVEPKNSPQNWGYLRSNGSTLGAWTDLGIPYSVGNGFATDINGDGLDDLVYDVSGALKSRVHTGVLPDLATSFVDGFGVALNPTYVPISQNNYTRYSDATYPDRDFQGAMYVVPSISASDGTGGTYTVSYWYYGARINLQGRGLVGFDAKRTVDSRNGLQAFSHFRRDFPYIGSVFQNDLFQPGGTVLMRRSVHTYASSTLDATSNNQRYFPYISQSISSIYEVGGPVNGSLITEVTTATTYDTYGNPTQVTTTTVDKDAASPWYTQSWQVQATNTITNDSTNWCIGLPSTSTLTRSAPGVASQTRTKGATVDYGLCRVTQETIEPASTTLKIVTDYGFDSCGNISSEAVTGRKPDTTAMPTRTTTTSYGSRCQLPVSTTNPLSQVTAFDYRYELSLLKSVSDPNGLATNWTFDDFGRKTRESRPDGTATDWSISACNAGNGYCGFGFADLRWAQLEVARNNSNAEITRGSQYLDGLGRVRVTEFKRPTGAFSYSVATYDALGRLATRSLPYGVSSNGKHQYSYDLANRPTLDQLLTASSAVDRQTSVVYTGRTVSATDPKNFVTQRVTDVSGALRRIVDPSPGGTTQYALDAFNNPTAVTDPAGNVTGAGFNLLGQQISASDPDRGTWTYTYNSLGELLTQTDAKSQVLTMTYDTLSRPLTRVEAEGTTTWTWGTSAAARNIGRLQSVTSPGGYAESYVFDSVARPQTVTYTADTNYQVDYAYNALGAIDTVEYLASTGAARFKAQYLYTFGAPTQVKDFVAGTTLWTLNTTDDRNNPIDETLGNGVRIISGFDGLTGEMTYRQSGSGGSTTNHQNLAYVWDKNGNLQQRQDINQSLTEVFFYDAMNRLDYSTLNGSTNLDVTLDAIGNISYKSDVGNYTYHATRKHAVASTSNGWSFTYDNNGNMLTGRGGTIGWTSYNLPSSVTQGSLSSQFSYGANRQYWKQIAQYSNGPETTYYIGGLLEKVVGSSITDYRHLIRVGSASIVVSRIVGGSNSVHYSTQDHLGSSSVVSNAAGSVLVHQSFGAYGARRGSAWSGNPSSGDFAQIAATSRHGFTGHTMLDNLGLVHMNGRVFDAAIGRFTSADPFIDDGVGSQGFNRFSYVGNSPLSAWDPTGFGTDDTLPIDQPTTVTVSAPRIRDRQWPAPRHGAPNGAGRNANRLDTDNSESGDSRRETEDDQELEEVTVTDTRILVSPVVSIVMMTFGPAVARALNLGEQKTCRPAFVQAGDSAIDLSESATVLSNTLLVGGLAATGVGFRSGNRHGIGIGLSVTTAGATTSLGSGILLTGGGVLQGIGGAGYANASRGTYSVGASFLPGLAGSYLRHPNAQSVSQRAMNSSLNNSLVISGATHDIISNLLDPADASCSN